MIKESNQLMWLKDAYGTSKDLVSKKEEMECSNIIEQYKKWLILMMLQKKS